jgi:hypothetical protein
MPPTTTPRRMRPRGTTRGVSIGIRELAARSQINLGNPHVRFQLQKAQVRRPGLSAKKQLQALERAALSLFEHPVYANKNNVVRDEVLRGQLGAGRHSPLFAQVIANLIRRGKITRFGTSGYQLTRKRKAA